MRLVELLVPHDAMPSCVAITADVLATANRVLAARGRAPAFALRVTGAGARGARALPAVVCPDHDAAAHAGRAADVLVVASVLTTTPEAAEARVAGRDARAVGVAVQAAVADGAEVAASCSGTFLLAAGGVLDDRRATTTWWLAPTFRRLFPRVALDAEAMVVRDGPATTAGAAMAHLDLMLALVARHAGPALAQRCARFLLVDDRARQAPYMSVALLAAQDPAVGRAERWARAHLGAGVTVEALAEAAGLTTRTLARRVERATGLSPVRFLQRLRLERATELLRTTALSVEEIARQVGYAEPTTLRRLLRRDAGGRPRDVRAAAVRGTALRTAASVARAGRAP